jgi:hypothetical protein
MLFKDFRHDLNQRLAKHVIKRLVDHCNSKGKYIGYKGGHIEKDLLIAAGAHHIINIETFGCPKFDVIRKERHYRQLASTFTRQICRSQYTKCRRHQGPMAHKYHCPLEEICIFAAWTIENVAS